MSELVRADKMSSTGKMNPHSVGFETVKSDNGIESVFSLFRSLVSELGEKLSGRRVEIFIFAG